MSCSRTKHSNAGEARTPSPQAQKLCLSKPVGLAKIVIFASLVVIHCNKMGKQDG